ncbi:MAG: hypothetical protein IJK74_04020 [Bacteroidales bacterium]|nr:hypothetical protein [Bacteroidales bacterium]
MKRFWMLAAIISICGMVLCSVSCTKDDHKDRGINKTTDHEDVLPTTDQLNVRVTANLPTAVLGIYEDNTVGASLVKRLNSPTTTIGDNTLMVLVKGSDLTNISDDIFKRMIDVIYRDGFIAITRPSANNFLYFVAKFIDIETRRQQAYIEDNYIFGSDVDVASDIRESIAARYNARFSTIRSIATKAGVTGSDQPLTEILVFSTREYYFQEPCDGDVSFGRISTDQDGITSDPEKVNETIELTAYHCGLVADGVADWLNGIDQQRQKTKAMTKYIATKAEDGSQSLNKLMNASETFTLSGPLYFRLYNYKLGWRQNSVVNNFYSWGVHNMVTNKDYYYIQQSTLIKAGNGVNTIFFEKPENTWKTATGYGDYDCWYGAFFSRYITSMNLTGKGSIKLEEAMPYTDNSTGYTTVNIGSEQSSTETIGISWGFTGGYMEASGSFGGDFSVGTTRGTYFEVSSTHVDNDISVIKNTIDNKVTWTYSGSLPTFSVATIGSTTYYNHSIANKSITSDINLDNQIIWSVSNPSGQYSLDVTSDPYTAALLFIYNNMNKYSSLQSKIEETHTWEKNNFSHTLLDPFRAMQLWRMYVTIDEMADGGPAGSAASKIEDRLRTKFSCFKDEISLCDRTSTSIQVINANILATKKTFTDNYDMLQQFAEEQGVKQYTIHWRCNSSDIMLREGFVVKTE